MHLQLEFPVITNFQRQAYAKGNPVAVGGISMTLAQRIAAHRATIAWGEDQLRQTRTYVAEHGCSFCTPNDWIAILDEFEAELEDLLRIAEGVAA